MRPYSLPLMPAGTGRTPQDLLLDLAIPSRPEVLEAVRERLDAVLRPLGLDETARDRIGLAAHEAMANAMIHGNRGDPGLAVGLRVLRDGGDLVIRVADRGPGFDPAAVADPLLPENRLRPGGRGLLMMKAMADAVEHASGKRGATAILRWRLGGVAPGPDSDH